MSEKRFFTSLADDEYTLIQEKGNLRATYLKYSEVVDLLNEQSERIKSLEMELDLIANTKLFSRRKLEEENEQMKKQLEQIPKSIKEVWLE